MSGFNDEHILNSVLDLKQSVKDQPNFQQKSLQSNLKFQAASCVEKQNKSNIMSNERLIAMGILLLLDEQRDQNMQQEESQRIAQRYMMELSKLLNVSPSDLASSYFQIQKDQGELLEQAQDYQIAMINFLTNSGKQSLYHIEPIEIVSKETFNQILLEHRKYLQASKGRTKLSFVQKKTTEHDDY